MKRVYRPYWEWEDYQAGMWTPVHGEKKRELLAKAVEFTGNAKLYGSWMRRVIVEWRR